jgi:hypothetical protein
MCQMKSPVIFPIHQRVFNQGLISFFSIAFARSCGIWTLQPPSPRAYLPRSLTVHFDLPSGGSEQAIRVNFASILLSIFGGAPLRAFSCNANSKPPSQYLFLIRFDVDLLTFNAHAISSSSRPSFDKSSILARVRLLAEDLPRRR